MCKKWSQGLGLGGPRAFGDFADGEHGPAHRAAGVHLVLEADESHAEVVELPDQHAVDLLVARGCHERVELGPTLPAA